jgi:hypothetical protein
MPVAVEDGSICASQHRDCEEDEEFGALLVKVVRMMLSHHCLGTKRLK